MTVPNPREKEVHAAYIIAIATIVAAVLAAVIPIAVNRIMNREEIAQVTEPKTEVAERYDPLPPRLVTDPVDETSESTEIYMPTIEVQPSAVTTPPSAGTLDSEVELVDYLRFNWKTSIDKKDRSIRMVNKSGSKLFNLYIVSSGTKLPYVDVLGTYVLNPDGIIDGKIDNGLGECFYDFHARFSSYVDMWRLYNVNVCGSFLIDLGAFETDTTTEEKK